MVNKKTEALLLTGIGECAGCQMYRGLCASADEALIRKAHQNGLSFGKYQVYLELLDSGATITPDECREMSMAELRSMMREQDGAGGGRRPHAPQPAESRSPLVKRCEG